MVCKVISEPLTFRVIGDATPFSEKVKEASSSEVIRHFGQEKKI